MKPEGAVKDALPIRNSTLPLQWLRIVLWPTLNQGRNISGGGRLPKIMFWMPETNTQYPGCREKKRREGGWHSLIHSLLTVADLIPAEKEIPIPRSKQG